jgi:hypothetical protein
MVTNTPITERRFREGSGEKYLGTGGIRCQGLAKTKVRKWREENDDYVTPTDTLWPECQCTRPAVVGMFACKWHGGITSKNKNNPKNTMEVLPVDLVPYYEAVRTNPLIVSRRTEIELLMARNLQLLDEIDEQTGSEESWATVFEALVELNRGEVQKTAYLLEKALAGKEKTDEAWREIRTNSKLLGELTNTQMRTSKELRLMATHEQVDSLMTGIMAAIIDVATKQIKEDAKRIEFITTISNRFGRLTGKGDPKALAWLESGSSSAN